MVNEYNHIVYSYKIRNTVNFSRQNFILLNIITQLNLILFTQMTLRGKYMNLEKPIKADEINPYQAPLTDTRPSSVGTSKQYYVVSAKKFFALFFVTLGLYTFYWFWKNWSIWKQRTGENIWPVPRAMFNIFFVHSLFNKIHSDASEVSSSSLSGLQLPATIFILCQIAINISDSLVSDATVTPGMLLLILLLAITSWCLWLGQKQANIASLDSEGNQNNKFTVINYLWLVCGSIFWILIFIGMISESFGLV